MKRYALDYDQDDYAYIERANRTLVDLFRRHALGADIHRVLDVGAGAGANAQALRALRKDLYLIAVEPNAQATRQAQRHFDQVHTGDLSSFLGSAQFDPVHAVILSDVVEHIENPVAFLRALRADPRTRDALFFISVPNYAVWYNRARTALGRFEYGFSGLYDRTHLRFFTRDSLFTLFEHVGLRVIESSCTPSLVQSLAPWLRRAFEGDVAAGNHLSLAESKAFRAYQKLVEPLESRVCQLFPELLGFQIVTVLRGAD